MTTNMISLKALLFFSRFLPRKLRNVRSLYAKFNSAHKSHQFKQKNYYPFLSQTSSNFSDSTLIFDIEGALLKSSSLFPYFFLVAFEAGGITRALILLLLYPLVCFVSKEMGLKIMVMVCFLGIKKESFRVGKAVLPKFFLQDVGLEALEVLMRGGRKVCVSSMPSVMVEGFLRDYLNVEVVVGRGLKEFNGYYVGLMEEKKDLLGLDGMINMVAIKSLEKKSFDDDLMLFSLCKEVYTVSEADKKSWHYLPKEKYPKPLIFHDGRLALRASPLDALALFLWIPLGFCLAIIRTLLSALLPLNISILILSFSGLRLRVKGPNTNFSITNKSNTSKAGVLYVCNHRTLMDPISISLSLGRPLNTVTYSLSRVSELLSPIRTVRLTRDREQDGKIVKKMLSEGDLVVCPEGTTCREPYLLRFSPLFAKMKTDVVPVAMDSEFGMFHGTTAGGLKCLDPLFFLMNPYPYYKVQFLEKVSSMEFTGLGDRKSSCEVANHVQKLLGKALGFECTNLTRKDKYLILAGNEGKCNT